MKDSRARPFERCIDIICELDNRRQKRQATRELCFFLPENVPGICFKPNRDKPSALDMLLATLRERLKQQWLFSAIRVNTLNYGLPQNRDRVYIIGRRASLYQLHVPRDPPVFLRGRSSLAISWAPTPTSLATPPVSSPIAWPR